MLHIEHIDLVVQGGEGEKRRASLVTMMMTDSIGMKQTIPTNLSTYLAVEQPHS